MWISLPPLPSNLTDEEILAVVFAMISGSLVRSDDRGGKVVDEISQVFMPYEDRWERWSALADEVRERGEDDAGD